MTDFPLLESLTQPSDLRSLSKLELEALIDEIRQFLIKNVSRTGGHLGPNLGVVELTVAMHLVFDSPNDPIIFDTGHQSYVHKILTGRADQFASLRQSGGLSGYPCRAESPHDWVENSHASTSLSWAEGMAQAFKLQGKPDRTVVAVVGDGALTGGMTWEALNNIAVEENLPLVIINNDNGRSYSETVGGLARVNQLSGLRTDPRYEQALDRIKHVVKDTPLVGRVSYDLLHGMKVALKDIFAPQTLFSDLGIKYIGPVDGHNVFDLVRAFEQAKGYRGPVIVHVMTRKGAGFQAAEDNEEDHFHTVGHIDEFTGEPIDVSTQTTWTDAFAEELVRLGDEHPEVVAITAAMLLPVGFGRFAAAYPDRVFDVGIAEQHAVACAAGMAASGLHPVVAVYSTFLNRAFDQTLLDVGMHSAGVTFVLDRAGITGPDGASHNGIWDVSLFSLVPGMRITSPRDHLRLREALDEAVATSDGPTLIRYSKEKLPDDIEPVSERSGWDYLTNPVKSSVALVATGQFVCLAMRVARQLEAESIPVTVIDPKWCIPINRDLVAELTDYPVVVTLEDNLINGGFGVQLEQELKNSRYSGVVHQLGVPHQFLEHGTRRELLQQLGLDRKGVSTTITGLWMSMQDARAHSAVGESTPSTQH